MSENNSTFLTVQQNLFGKTDFTINKAHVVCVSRNQNGSTAIHMDLPIGDYPDSRLIIASTPSYEDILAWLKA